MSATGSATVLLKKRERTQNWVPEEKNALFALIKSHVNAIENKKIDAAASAMKALAWQQIYCAFRGRFSTERDITRMREQWRRMKAQARIEMYTFAEKVRTLGPEEAAKCRPSNLSIEVWSLMENTRKNNSDTADRSDESSQDVQDNSQSLHAILGKLTAGTTEISVHEIKVEANSDVDNTEDEASPSESLPNELTIFPKKRQKISDDEPMDLAEQKKTNRGLRFNNEESDDLRDENLSNIVKDRNDQLIDCEESRARWIFEAAQKEHDLKLKMLNIELERSELQKQSAINVLKTSEVKKQLIESQAAEYYSQIRMVGEPGSGAGKGGGGGGTIRQSGGAFGIMEAVNEDHYFYKQQKEQLKKLREELHDEISFHEEQIKRHQEAIHRHKIRITDMNDK